MLRPEFPTARIVVLGPATNREVARAREARLELVVSDEIPDGVATHVKLDTGMGRWGLSELPSLVARRRRRDDASRDRGHGPRLRPQPARALSRGDAVRVAADTARGEQRRSACAFPRHGSTPPGAGSRCTASRRSAGTQPTTASSRCSDGRREIAQSKLLPAGSSTGYGRLYVAEEDTWIGILPVGYADGFRRDLTGTEVRVGGELRRIVGAVSMDATAVELDRELPPGTPVTIVGRGLPLEEPRPRCRDDHI